MTEIENKAQARTKAKEYLVVPIGVAQGVVDNPDLYEFDEVELRSSSEGDAYRIQMTGEWGGDFQAIMQIHIKKADGELLFWRNFGTGENNHGAIGKAFYKKYWLAGD